MKIMIFGGGSDIAQAVIQRIKNDYDFVSYDHDQCDITDYVLTEKKVREYADVFLNCAGYCARENINGYPYKAEMEISVNLLGAYHITRAVCFWWPNARLIHIGSDAGLKPKPMMVMYAASKAGLISMVSSVKAAGYDIHVINPKIVNTKMSKEYIYDPDDVLSPDDVAGQIEEIIRGKK